MGIFGDYFDWNCPNGNLHTFFDKKDLPIVSDEHFWVIDICGKFNLPTALVIRYEGDLDKDSFMENSSHRKIAYQIFTKCERLPKGINITKTFVQTRPSAFIHETLLSKFLHKIQGL